MKYTSEKNMFCFQCQETAGCSGCTRAGVCGKTARTANLQDLLLYATKGLACALTLSEGRREGFPGPVRQLVRENLFITITNANFDDERILDQTVKTLEKKREYAEKLKTETENQGMARAARWEPAEAAKDWREALSAMADQGVTERFGVLSEADEDIRSLKELITYGLKGMAAYLKHASVLGKESEETDRFLTETLARLEDRGSSPEELTGLALETGKYGVTAMALLDQANTERFGHPEVTKVSVGVRKNPGILISGHDLRDLELLLEQTEGTGVDVYTHSEMLPAHYYPAFKKYSHFAGNYGNAWWKQTEEFDSFRGPVLLTTNCLVPPRAGYRDRVYTTGAVGFAGCPHIEAGADGKKDFSPLIAHAKRCEPPKEIETGEIVGGFAHNQVMALADQVVEAVKTGAIRRFIVMAGCDGRNGARGYYTDFAKALPKDTVILTAGCAKYRYNKLNLGEIGGIPRVLDAGQCNDSYSLAVIALKLKEAFGLEDINELPISYNIAWYEQKAVIVLLALLSLGVKNIHLGPTLPAFLSPNVAKTLTEQFGIAGIATVDEDLELFLR